MGGDSGDKLGDYVAVLEREAKQNGELPKVEIKCDLSYTLKLPASKVDRDIVTVPEVFASAALAPVKAAARALGAILSQEKETGELRVEAERSRLDPAARIALGRWVRSRTPQAPRATLFAKRASRRIAVCAGHPLPK